MCRAIAVCVALIFLIPTHTVYGAVITTSKNARLSEVDWNNYNYREPTGAGTYAFGYEVEDPETSNVQYRNEEKHSNGSITGSYGYLMPDGNVQEVNYIADENGYRASVKIVPRNNLKPVQLGVPENTLFDFSSNIPPRPSKSIGSAIIPGNTQQLNQQFPYNVPNYISTHLETPNPLLENERRYRRPPNNFRLPVTFGSNIN
ncbi:hypothetical protein Trydic_g14775 [Trypoxylus dichotomus]